MARCRIVGPYLPVGDVDWRCALHEVEAVRVTFDEPLRRTQMRCPIGEPESVERWAAAARAAGIPGDDVDRERDLIEFDQRQAGVFP